jgi:GNAT superfamily N-acetyltransferase
MVQIRPVHDPEDPAIRKFGDLQERTYGDPEMLIPPAVLPEILATQTPERRNLMLVVEEGEEVVGGDLFHYFSGPNTGFSSYLAVAHEARGRGLARQMHEARFALLDEVAGVRAPVAGVFIDVVAPERLTPVELAQEYAVGADPVARRQIFHRLGFRRVDVAYEQPAEGSGGVAVTNMDLLYCPRRPTEMVPTELVVETMRAYWAPWLGRSAADRNAAELQRRCGGAMVALR